MAFSSGSVSVGTSAELVFDAGEDYPRVILKNTHATNTVFLGAAGVTTGTGFELVAGATVTLQDITADLYAVATVSGSLRYLAW